MGESLQISLVVLGVLVVGVVYVFNLYQDRVARKRLESAFSPKQPGQPDASTAHVVSIQESLGDGVPLRGVPTSAQNGPTEAAVQVQPTMYAAQPNVNVTAPASTSQSAFPAPLGQQYAENSGAMNSAQHTQQHLQQHLMSEVANNAHAASGQLQQTSAAHAGVLGFADSLPMPPVDLAVESVTRIVSSEPISPTVLQAAMTIPMGKGTAWLGWSETRQQWERLVPQAVMDAYRVVIISLLLVDRQGSVNDVQLNTFFRLIENLAKNVGGQCDLPRMEAELHRALVLDRKCAELDIQVNMSVMRSPQQGSIAATRLRGVAEACGFRWAKNGRFEFFDEQGENLLFVMINSSADQPFLPETLHTMQTHGITLVLDVPNVPDPVKAFDQMRSISKRLSSTLDAVLVDDQRRMINEGSFSAIRQTIEQTVSLMLEYQMSPGSVRTLRLFS